MIKISTFQNRKLIEVYSGLSKKASKIYLESKDFQYIQRFKENFYKVSHTKWQKIKEIKDFKKLVYYLEVWANTNQYYITHKQKGFVIDHIVPISYGFKNNINPKLIGSANNCQTITTKENLTKGIILNEIANKLLIEWGLIK